MVVDESKPRKSSRKRRVVMLLLGVGMGLLCKVLPPEYHPPCGVATKVIGLLLGVP